ncbi:MAG TPA: OFA family MFS transporter [Syntrophales bacterium]|nr:OFA family MFS transporter [Syntrophales bacterium]HOX95013.1 OFA family MFS transporter [Syntrophales bacterium]HPI58226.1 OFA family MFS transporter [Syntrophales bacterium]HPN25592.1 OFA family MFS transporter [Syntrophales bacterium]HQM28150.1 OFA family MFS transporter [Syntrophales bacterium]
MTMGVTYSWSVIKKALVSDWQWTNVEASLPLTIYTAIFALAMVFAGRMQDKLGPRLVANTGGIFMATGLISCSFTSTPLLMTIAYGITGIGNGLCYSTTIPASIKWFPPEKKGFATGIVVSGIGLATVYISPIANWLIGHYGIPKTFLFLGTGAFLIIMMLAQFLSNPPHGYHPKTKLGLSTRPVVAEGHLHREVHWREMIRIALFYKLWFMYFFAASAGLLIIGHIAAIAKTQAHWENGYYLVIFFALLNTSGRLVAGFLSDLYGRLSILLCVFLLQAVNLVFFVHYVTPTSLALGAMTTGLCYGTFFALFPLVTADFFGMKNFGGNYGLLFLAWGFAGILGPILAGFAVDKTGTYHMAYLVSAGLLVGSFLLALTIRPAKVIS